MKAKYIAALIIMLVGVLATFTHEVDDTPTPAPLPPDAFSLKGKFIGPEASSDAAGFSALCDELAEVIEWDGMQPDPRLKTASAFDDLRISAREARMKGVSLGARQPKAREAIKAFMEEELGTYGGPVTPEVRSAWVKTLKAIGRAAADAAK